MKNKILSNKETKEFVELIKAAYHTDLSITKRDKVEFKDNIVRINEAPSFFYLEEDKPLPTLKLLLQNNFLKKVTVDKGAVKFVASGADVMRPGITKIDESIAKEEIVAVVDEMHGKPLAIGRALFSSEEMQGMQTGKTVKSLHYVGDKIWSIS